MPQAEWEVVHGNGTLLTSEIWHGCQAIYKITSSTKITELKYITICRDKIYSVPRFVLVLTLR
jgi:hypothetical protein